jgi:hypothetical protein
MITRQVGVAAEVQALVRDLVLVQEVEVVVPDLEPVGEDLALILVQFPTCPPLCQNSPAVLVLLRLDLFLFLLFIHLMLKVKRVDFFTFFFLLFLFLRFLLRVDVLAVVLVLLDAMYCLALNTYT